jgi:hypothetical protein
MPIVKLFLTHWFWQRVVSFIERGNRAHDGCDKSTEDAYSFMAPNPTSDIFRGPCTPVLWFEFPIGLMRLITDHYFWSFHTLVFQHTSFISNCLANCILCQKKQVCPIQLWWGKQMLICNYWILLQYITATCIPIFQRHLFYSFEQTSLSCIVV